jgi:DNA-binding transcriptional ArsR family regulator
MIRINRKMTRFFSTLADETRLKILMSLTDGPKTVNQIYADVGKDTMTLSAVSHQLRQMNDLDIIASEKKGREKIFQLSHAFCWCILKDAKSHFGSKTACPACARMKKQHDR